MVSINGEEFAVDGVNLKEYLEQNGYNLLRIAVEMNEEIVPKAAYGETILESGAKVEVVSFVGGG